MAKRRMLSIPILETDKFYNLTTAAQALYLHLNLNADDDGVVDRVKLITNQMRIKKKCYDELLHGGYIIELDEGLVAITHWHQHNQIRKERYVKGEYLDRLSSLSLQENGRFIKASSEILGDKCAPQDRIGKDSTVEDSKAKDRVANHREEEKREEKNNISLFLTDIHSTAASQTEPSGNVFLGTTSFEKENKADTTFMQALKNAITLHFMKKYGTTDIGGFMEYCIERNWIGEDGGSMKNEYKRYADEWMAGR